MSETTNLTAGEHHPNCYQSTGVPDDLPAGLCDCRVLRAIDAAEPDATTDPTAGDRLAEELCEWSRSRAIAEDVLSSDWLDAVRRKAGDERAEQIAQAIEAVRITCPVHGIPDCSPLLNGCSVPIRLNARRAEDARIARGES